MLRPLTKFRVDVDDDGYACISRRSSYLAGWQVTLWGLHAVNFSYWFIEEGGYSLALLLSALSIETIRCWVWFETRGADHPWSTWVFVKWTYNKEIAKKEVEKLQQKTQVRKSKRERFYL